MTPDVVWNNATISAPQPPPPRRRRWPFVSLAACIIAMSVAAVVVWSWQRSSGDVGSATHPDWQPPPQTVIVSSLRAQPVAGWKARVEDLGLPTESKIATAGESAWSQPLIGYLGNSGYMLASSPDPLSKQWWLVGVDVVAGKRLFDPVKLDTGLYAPKCFLNGPTAVLCVRDDVESATAWIVDTHTGSVSFTGPTQLRTAPGILGVRQVGDFAIAEAMNKGVYGIGPRAETTWFVPGKGSVGQRSIAADDVAPQTLATQDAGGDRMEIFSVIDGSVVTPEVSDGVHPLSAAVYPGGFAVEVVRDESNSTPDAVEFFDKTGQRLGAAKGSAFLSPGPADVPIVESAPNSVVFGSSGQKLAEIARFGPGDSAILIGPRLFVDGTSVDGGSRQYDLQTGTEGKTCDIHLSGYLGTDGKVGVFDDGNPNVGLVTKGVDLATCDVLWQIQSPVGSFRNVWRVNTTLVQLSDDGTELTSLIAPS